MTLKEFIKDSIAQLAPFNPGTIEYDIWIAPERRIRMVDGKSEFYTDIVIVNESPNASRLKFKVNL